jgi:glycosyltransferase involved in cell wall biosynthesis
MTSPRDLRRLLVISHVVHYEYGGRLWAYAPYARELNMWAQIFPELVIAAPRSAARPPGDCEAFTQPNIHLRPQSERGGNSLGAKLRLVASVPHLTTELVRALREADAVHVRCPGNLGLLGVVLAPLFSKYLVAKYAGQWSGYPREPLATRLQRVLLASAWWRGPVLVYGGESASPNIVPFFTSALTEAQVDRARTSSRARRSLESPLRVLYVGRLSRAKHVDVLIDAIADLRVSGVPVQCSIVGEGPERNALASRVAAAGVGGQVTFAGGVPLDAVLDFYERADVLVLASETEGWPKAIAEAMAFGLVCIGSNRGLVPTMLGDGRGVVVAPGDRRALTEALCDVVRRPSEYPQMSARAASWAQQYSLESFRDALRSLLVSRWGSDVLRTVHVAEASS